MMNLRLLLLVILSGVLGLTSFVPGASAVPSISTHAVAAALIDVNSGRVLYSHNGDKLMRIASLTKVMTAIVAIEAGSLSDKVKVSNKAYGVEGSSIYLHLGEEMSLQHLLYGLMLRSGNDAAVAIAEHVGGSLEGFILLMNEKAKAIGMVNSTFKNPHGLDADGHLSTANDMALLTAYALNNPIFRDIVKTPSISVPNPYEKWDHKWRNKNKMLYLYEGADGVKTGYTKVARRCLISSATRNGQQLAAVTLNDGDDWGDHSRLLDHGFKHYPLEMLYLSGKVLTESNMASPYTFSYPLSEEERNQVEVNVEMINPESLPGKLGQKALATYSLNGAAIGKLPFYQEGHPILKQPQELKFGRADATFQSDMLIREDAISMMKRMFRALFSLQSN
jgi:D-alanyl-D-alanine carboxypeptidase (penicillin-binding protein 5/6)